MTDLKERSNAGTSTSSSTFRNSRINSSPVRHRRVFMKETVPTALVSPQTIQVKVQPPMVPYNFRQRSPLSSSQHRIYSNEFGSDLNCTQTSSFAQSHSKLSAPNSSTSLHEDHANMSSSSNISMFSDNNLNYGGESDDRLESLEKRMRYLEARLHDYEIVYGRNLRPQTAHSSCTNLMNNSQHNINHNCTTGSASSINGRNQESDLLKDKIRKLQIELDSERRLRDKQMKENSKELLWKVDENKTLRCRVRELESENHLWQERFRSYNNIYYQPNAIEELLKEKDAMHKTINELNAKLELQKENANFNKKVDTYPEDQYVPIEKYRALKAKSKKLLSEKCRSLRTEILEKESIKVQIQLQNAELSELRKTVYESNGSKCDCVNVSSAKIREEILKSAQNCHFAASCLLGVCEDVVAKKTPDYDQILGLKSSAGVSISDQKWDHKVLDSAQIYNEQLFMYIQNLNNDIIRMQRLMVDYYTNELVDTIDCRLQ